MKKLSECEKHMPKETLLQKISCKFVANVLQLPENKKATFMHLSTNILWMEYKLNNFLTQPSGAPLHTLSKLFHVPVCFVTPPSPKGGWCSILNDMSSFHNDQPGNHKLGRQGLKLTVARSPMATTFAPGLLKPSYSLARVAIENYRW